MFFFETEITNTDTEMNRFVQIRIRRLKYQISHSGKPLPASAIVIILLHEIY